MVLFKNNFAAYMLRVLLVASVFIFSSCRTRTKDYIRYYNEVNKIDSIYRFQKDTLTVIKKYRRLFRKYTPKNQDRIKEFETYIILADKYHKNFGGKKTLQKFTSVLAPYGKTYEKYLDLYSKYGIDSTTVKKEIANWKNSLNKKLVDSFTVAFLRDQQEERAEKSTMIVNDKKNAELLKWTLENYGFPSINKIGIVGNNDIFMPMDNFLGHMIQSEYYPFFKDEVLKAVKSGDCPPRLYAILVDKYNFLIAKKEIPYGVYQGPDTVLDTTITNKNRRGIGLPSLSHSRLITKDFFKKK